MSSSVHVNRPSFVNMIRSLLPALQAHSNKGQAGRVGVIGGSKAFAGAPYFSAMTTMRMGCDLVTVFCSQESAGAIKGYSPDLMVTPLFFSADHLADAETMAQSKKKAETYLKQLGKDVKATSEAAEPITAVVETITAEFVDSAIRLDVLITGPGLSKDPFLLHCAAKCIEHVREERKRRHLKPLPVIYDGDGVALLLAYPELLAGDHAKWTIITPNSGEFRRLWDKFGGNITSDLPHPDTHASAATLKAVGEGSEIPVENDSVKHTALLAKTLGGCTILRKGSVDVISNGTDAGIIAREGSPRRVGGQGDVLAGATGAFVLWSLLSAVQNTPSFAPGAAQAVPSFIAPAMCASYFTRYLASDTFAKLGRAMVASDLVSGVGEAIKKIAETQADIPSVLKKLEESSLHRK